MAAIREPALASSTTTVRHWRSRTHANFLLILLTIAGGLLRFWHLGGESLWLDEGATVALARTSWQHFAWVWWHGEASLQTIYFLLMRGWVHGGLSEAWLRLPSAFFGTVSIPLLYIVSRRCWMGTSEALAAAALLAFSPAHVYYSQEARSYALAIALVLLSTYFFLLAVERGDGRDWALWTVFAIAAFYTHYFTVLVPAAQAASLLFKPRPAPWRKVALCGAVVFAAAVPGLTYVFRAAPENLHFVWMPRADGKQVWHLLMFFGGSGVKVALALVLWTLGVVAIARARRIAPILFWRGCLVLLWAVLPAVILGLISLREPMFLQRYMVFSLPAAVLLAGLGSGFLRKWKLGIALVIALCAASLPSIAKQYRKPREDWRSATNAVLTNAAPGDAVAFFPFYTRIMLDCYSARVGTAPPLHVFAPGFYAVGEDDRNLLAELDRNPHSFRHVWLFFAGANPADADRAAQLQAKLQAIFGRPSERKFADVEVLEYGR
ncbi:MAG TPA: glycosyltransferase family 39 protein [Terriglobales bacterium]|nr:glycosyltransferase family 39 protein [Terriglobales bacterium]